uniref:Uncharacterized protein n=1 Tax=Siphoviridae sp. ctLdn10 TaxID=2827847 RepID=A0A8S5SQ21_9CAUD|nr:MAG TPA: hypothetical protein [Siphoviridae sp. ctLdn10]
MNFTLKIIVNLFCQFKFYIYLCPCKTNLKLDYNKPDEKVSIS